MTPCLNQQGRQPQRRAPPTAQVGVPQDRKPFSTSGVITLCPISLCSDSRQIRLADGGGRCSGRVEILDQGSWGTICDDHWDLDDARVVCRQLGCGEALSAMGSAHFGAGSGPIWLDEVSCRGEESQVWRCPAWGWQQHNCVHQEDAGVICSGMVSSLSTGWENGKFQESWCLISRGMGDRWAIEDWDAYPSSLSALWLWLMSFIYFPLISLCYSLFSSGLTWC